MRAGILDSRNPDEGRGNMDILIALVPPIFAGIALYFILRWINRADRSERAAQREAEKDAQLWYEQVKSSRGSVNPFTDDKP